MRRQLLLDQVFNEPAGLVGITIEVELVQMENASICILVFIPSAEEI